MNNGKKKMTKSISDKLLTGTLGGLAEYFGWNSTVVRIVFVVLSIFPGHLFAGALVYIAMMVIIPNDYSSFNNFGGFGNQDSYDNSDSSGRKVIHDVEEHDKRN
ncbi:PspC domain-containing protein [Apilactobacillus xinyiensis]|uniref:PspC domain-containing protein n=1 Tax=Apilactobacillus xinyiensis TaxID=2841032 RepID=UPI001C7D7E21|nr:PspC domain-containing protein [Apilactobacillus xinyiensis]MCL0330285.1 PspC domain-containing protein [Apilactobacillus xinyiensis]